MLAEAANASTDGKLNVLGVFDTVFATEFPAVHPRCVLVVRFRPGVEDVGETRHLEIRYEDVDQGGALWTVESDVEVSANAGGRTLTNLLTLTALPVPQEGEFQFRILVDGAEKSRLPLYVRKTESEGG
jgi:hypothetical protein